jgi:hypothetical protein
LNDASVVDVVFVVVGAEVVEVVVVLLGTDVVVVGIVVVVLESVVLVTDVVVVVDAQGQSSVAPTIATATCKQARASVELTPEVPVTSQTQSGVQVSSATLARRI